VTTGGAGAARRWWLYPVTALLVLAALELLSFVAYRLVEGRWFSYRAVHAGEVRLSRPQPAGVPDTTVARPQEFLREDVLHPYLGFVGDPALDPGFTDWGFWGTLGPHPPARGPDRLLVGIFGGSLAADLYEYGGARLKARLRESGLWAGREIVLLNTAYGGYKQPQQLMALNYALALGAQFDIVVNLDGFNDVALDASENAPQGVFPAYPRGWAMRVERFHDPALVEQVGLLAYLRGRRAGLAAGFAARPWRYSVTAGLVWTLLDRLSAARVAEARRALDAFRPADRRYQATGPARPATEAAAYEELASVWERGSLQLDRLCRANGIRYFHFLQPNQYVEGSKPMGPAERRVAVNPAQPYRAGVERGYPLLQAKGREIASAGVSFHDLTRVFSRIHEPLYVDDCCHVNQRGYELLADAIADAIVADHGR
jgi:hypothetical protein